MTCVKFILAKCHTHLINHKNGQTGRMKKKREHKEERMRQKPCAQQISRESHPAENETASDKWLSSRSEDEKSKPAVFTMSCPSKQHLA